MPLDYDFLMGLPPIETTHELTVRDSILYALGVGVGAENPTDASELQYVYEDGLKALPSMAVILAYPGFWMRDPKYKLTWQSILHGESSIEIHRPLPTEGRLLGVTKISEICDKGADKGAVVYSSRKVTLEGSGELVATVSQSHFLRADGGFGGSPEASVQPHPMPTGPADLTVTTKGRADQALIYRLSGDTNPLHIDPAVARQGGFDRPILHGLCSFGITGRALVKALCDDKPERVKRLDVRFSKPVFPGENFEIEIWREGPGKAAFRVRIPERDAIVLQNGYVEFGD
jgi:acyl dehydratase